MNIHALLEAHALRRTRITAAISTDSSGIEYGPLHNPVAPREKFTKVRYVDFASRAQLVEKYKNDPNVNVAQIPEVDIVTNGAPISAFVADGSVDFVIASHVMEHVPDLIGWLETNLNILRPGGRIAVAFPDRRYCFDLANQPTGFHELVAAYFEKRTRPSFTQICDHLLNTRNVPSPVPVWNGTLTAENAPLAHETPAVLPGLRKLATSTDYHDVHCWKFSDEELFDMIARVRAEFHLPFEVLSMMPTRRNTLEFYMTLLKV